MSRIGFALTVLFGGMPKVVFGLEKATAIFKAAKGRYNGDESKAVPFAILETARAMGAEITVFEEAKAEKAGIASDIAMAKGLAASVTKQKTALIKELEDKKKAAEQAIKNTNEDVERRVGALGKESQGVDAVVNFFKI